MSFESQRREGIQEKSKEWGNEMTKKEKCPSVTLFCHLDYGRAVVSMTAMKLEREGSMLADVMV
jgi:hypothetical protein